jgi:cation/acetate symporter
VWSMYGGLGAAVILILLSPVFWGTPTSVFADTGTAIWPFNNPGIVSIPLGFFLGWLGSVTSRTREDPRKAAEMDVRSLTGYGAEKAASH